LLPEVLYPPADAIRPTALVVSREQSELVRAPLTRSLTGDLARWLGDFSRGTAPPRDSEARALFDALASACALTSIDDARPPPSPDGDFVGHATVALGRENGRILVDPYFLPRSPRFPDAYQPIIAGELGPLAAVCITHCHPDHFSLGSLLRLGPATRIFVPRV